MTDLFYRSNDDDARQTERHRYTPSDVKTVGAASSTRSCGRWVGRLERSPNQRYAPTPSL